MKNHAESYEELMALLECLPEFERKAVMWLIEHISLLEKLCTPDDPIPEEMLRKEIQTAREEQDYVYLALLEYQKKIQEQRLKNAPSNGIDGAGN